MNYLELGRLLLPEIWMVSAALLALGLDLKLRTTADLSSRRGVAVWTGLAGCAVAMGWLILVAPDGAVTGGMFVSDTFTRLVKMLLIGLTAGTLLLSSGWTFTTHLGEYVAVILMGAVGMMLIASSENVLMMFLALELASLCLYILTGFDKRDPQSSEAALKYFLFGGMSGAFLLFGLSLLYGVTGSTEFRVIAGALETGTAPPPLLLTGFVMIFVGLGFKVAAVPFHFWAPDAYQGAPTPAAAFIAAASKVASFFILAKFTGMALSGAAGTSAWSGFTAGWSPVIALLAVGSMLWGNLAALRQANVKRLLAYSAIAHAGYTLIAIIAGGADGMLAVTFYAGTYALTALGAFGVVGLVEKATGGSDFEHFAGLFRRSPGVAFCLALFILSLAGIPPLAGFFGKFYLFAAALDQGGDQLGLLWLVGIAAATTCVSFYYYLRLLKAAFVEEPAGEIAEWRWGGLEGLAVVSAAVLVLAAGCAPGLFLSPLEKALSAAGM